MRKTTIQALGRLCSEGKLFVHTSTKGRERSIQTNTATALVDRGFARFHHMPGQLQNFVEPTAAGHTEWSKQMVFGGVRLTDG